MQMRVKYLYRTLKPDQYLVNQQRASVSRKNLKSVLKPFPLMGTGIEDTTDEIQLIGNPYRKQTPEEIQNIFKNLARINRPDSIFLQIDPSMYIAKQRFISHKHALHEVEDFEVDGVEQIDFCKPMNWQECVVDLTILDMLENNKVYGKYQNADTLSTFGYKDLVNKEENFVKTQSKFIVSITDNIVGRYFSPCPTINEVLFTALMAKHKVVLGGMPDLLYRQILGNDIEIQELRDLFKYILNKMKELEQNISMREATHLFLPHIFQLPKDLYMTALLKEQFMAAMNTLAYVENPHQMPINEYWVGSPHGVNFTQATTIHERIKGESDQDLIEKQAILDVMLETQSWGQEHVSNAFPYIEKDITQISKNDYVNMQKCFLNFYKMYESFRVMQLRGLPNARNHMDLLAGQQSSFKNELQT